MQPDFDQIVNRINTDSLKYDFAKQRGMPQGLLPLWVADMDFPAPKPVLDALTERAQHGIFGYSDTREDYNRILQDWFLRRFGWQIDPTWNVKTPGVVYAICTALRAFTKEGDAVLIQPPVYYPFSASILANERRLVLNELVYENGAYHIDFQDFEEKIIAENVQMFILCSPHNPVGRVWKRDELLRLGEICQKHGVLVVSDEIHADFVNPGHVHTPFLSLPHSFTENVVLCTAPTKTFNLAGLQISNILIPSQKLRRAFRKEMERSGYSQVSTMGILACKAAYAHGEPWLTALQEYLAENLAFVRTFLQTELPQIHLVEPDGTYLIWLDCRAVGLSHEALDELMVQKARLWLDGGTMFGAGGEGFQRINIACPRSILAQAMQQLKEAFTV